MLIFPSHLFDNITNTDIRHIVSSAQLTVTNTRCVKMSYFTNLFPREFRHVMQFSTRATLRMSNAWIAFWVITQVMVGAFLSAYNYLFRPCKSSFPGSILQVICDCSEKQMVRINTWRIVTGMTRQQAIGYRCPVVKLPREVGSSHILSVDFKSTITAVLTAARPNPTGIRFLDILPKPFFWTTIPRLPIAFMRAVFESLPFHFGWSFNYEGIATVLTYFGNHQLAISPLITTPYYNTDGALWH